MYWLLFEPCLLWNGIIWLRREPHWQSYVARAPSAATVLTYALEFTLFSEPYLVELITYALFVLITIVGIATTYHA
jgi:hypothetical protein